MNYHDLLRAGLPRSRRYSEADGAWLDRQLARRTEVCAACFGPLPEEAAALAHETSNGYASALKPLYCSDECKMRDGKKAVTEAAFRRAVKAVCATM